MQVVNVKFDILSVPLVVVFIVGLIDGITQLVHVN